MSTAKVDSVFRTRSLGTAASGTLANNSLQSRVIYHFVTGLTDQYADGKAAKVWKLYIGDTTGRTDHYREFLKTTLKKNDCHRVLDAACGTGLVIQIRQK